MNAFKILVAFVVMAVFAAAAPALAGSDKPFYEDELYHSEKSIMGNPEQVGAPAPLFEDRYENFLYETEKQAEQNIGRASESADRFYGIQPGWDGWE